MSSFRHSLLALFLITIGVGIQAQSSQKWQLNPTKGHTIFTAKHCNDCHSIWGVGGNEGPDLGRTAMASNIYELSGYFWNHSPKMMRRVEEQGREWPTFTPDEMEAFLSYLYALNLLDDPGNANVGMQLLADKHCLTCHQLDGVGKRNAPSLDSFAQWTNPIPLAQAMWNAGHTMRTAQKAKGIRMPTFKARDMSDIQSAIRRWGKSKSSKRLTYLSPPNPSRGKILYREKKCHVCHGGQGEGRTAPSLIDVSRKQRLGAMAGALWNHSYAMEKIMALNRLSLPKLKGQDMADILSFIYFEGFTGSAGGSAEAGVKLFQKKGCDQCHGAPGAGPVPGPPIKQMANLKSPVELITAMWNHVPEMRRWMNAEILSWPTFKGGELRDIWLFIQSAAPKNPPQKTP